MLHPTDDPDRASYPRLVFQARLRRPKCRVCDLLPAKCARAGDARPARVRADPAAPRASWGPVGRAARFVTYGDRLTAENPTFFCEQCYDIFHYDAGGQILYDDFTVFDYEPA